MNRIALIKKCSECIHLKDNFCKFVQKHIGVRKEIPKACPLKTIDEFILDAKGEL